MVPTLTRANRANNARRADNLVGGRGKMDFGEEGMLIKRNN
jgi:hypothetical protein